MIKISMILNIDSIKLQGFENTVIRLQLNKGLLTYILFFKILKKNVLQKVKKETNLIA